MNTQYPAGTGFDPRFQRPRGVNVGGVGNLYAPQPEEQEEGINPLAVIAGLAGLGATALGGYYGGKRLGMWGKGRPGAPVPDRPVNPDPTPGPAPQASQSVTNPELYARRSGGETYQRRMPIAPNQKRGNLFAKLGEKRIEDLENSDEISNILGSLLSGSDPWRTPTSKATTNLDQSGYVQVNPADDLWAQVGAVDIGGTGNIFRNLNAQKTTLTDVEAAPKVAQQAVVDEVAPGPTTLTDVKRSEEKAQEFVQQSLEDFLGDVGDSVESRNSRIAAFKALSPAEQEAKLQEELSKPPKVGAVTPVELPTQTKHGIASDIHNHLLPDDAQIPKVKTGDALKLEQWLARKAREQDWAERRAAGKAAASKGMIPGTIDYTDPGRGGWSRKKLDMMVMPYVDESNGVEYKILRPAAALQAAADGWIDPSLAQEISAGLTEIATTGGTISQPLAESLGRAYGQISSRFDDDPHGHHIPQHSLTGDLALIETKGANMTNGRVNSTRDFSPLEAWMVGPDGSEGTAQTITVSTTNASGKQTLPNSVMAYTTRYVPRKGIEDITFGSTNPGQTGTFAVGANPYEEYVYGENPFLTKSNAVGHNYDGKGNQVIDDDTRYGAPFTRDEVFDLYLAGRKTLPDRTSYSTSAGAIGGDKRYGYGSKKDNPRGVKPLATYELTPEGISSAVRDGVLQFDFGPKVKGRMYTKMPAAIGMQKQNRASFNLPFGQNARDGLPVPAGIVTDSLTPTSDEIASVIGALADAPDNNLTRAVQARMQGDRTVVDVEQELAKAYDHLQRWNLNAVKYNQEAKGLNSLIGSVEPRKVEGVLDPFVERVALSGRSLSEALREDLSHDPRERFNVSVPDPAKPGSTKVVAGRSPSEAGYMRLLHNVHGGDRVVKQMVADGTTILQRVPHNDGVRYVETEFQAPRSQLAEGLDVVHEFFVNDGVPKKEQYKLVGGTPIKPLIKNAQAKEPSESDIAYKKSQGQKAVAQAAENIIKTRDEYIDDISSWNKEETEKRYNAVADTEVFPADFVDALLASVRSDEDVVSNNPRYFENAVDPTRQDVPAGKEWMLGPGGAPRSTRLKIGGREFDMGPIEERMDAVRTAESQYDAAINGETYGLLPPTVLNAEDRKRMNMPAIDPETLEVTRRYLMSDFKPQVVTRRYVNEDGNNVSKRLYIGGTMQDMEKRYRAYSGDNFPVGSTVKNLYDYHVPVGNLSNLQIIAEKDPEGLVALALDSGFTPSQMQTKILANPEKYSAHVVNQAQRGKIPSTHIVFPEKGGNKNYLPTLAGVSQVLKRNLNYASAPIEDAIAAGRFDANKYLGKTSVIPAKGLLAARTMTRVNADGMAVPQARADKVDAFGNYEYQDNKDLTGPSMAYQELQRNFPELRPGYEPDAAGPYSRIRTQEVVAPYTFTSPLRINAKGEVEAGPGGGETTLRGPDYLANLRVNNAIPVSRMVERGKRLGIFTDEQAAALIAQDKEERPSLYGRSAFDLRTDYEKRQDEQAARREGNRQIIKSANVVDQKRRAPLPPQKLLRNRFAEDGENISLQDAQAIIDDRKPPSTPVTPTTKAALQRGLDKRAARLEQDKLRRFGRFTFVEEPTGELKAYDDVTASMFGSGLPGDIREALASEASMDERGRLVINYQGEATPVQPAPRVNLTKDDIQRIQRRPNTNQEQTAAEVIGRVLGGEDVDFATDTEALKATGMTRGQLRTEIQNRTANLEQYNRRNPRVRQGSLFDTNTYVPQYEELVTFMTPDGRMSRATQKEIDRIANTQAQENIIAKLRRLENAPTQLGGGERATQYSIPGLFESTQLPLFDVNALTSREIGINRNANARQDRRNIKASADQLAQQRSKEGIYMETIPGLSEMLQPKQDLSRPGYVQRKVRPRESYRVNYNLAETPSENINRSTAAVNTSAPIQDVQQLIASAVSRGLMSQEDATRYYSAKLAEQQAVQRRRQITPEIRDMQTSIDNRIDEMNDYAEIPMSGEAAREKYYQRMNPRQGVHLRNLNG